jgi:hypothetical protein
MRFRIIILFVLATAGISARAQTGFPFDNEIRDFKHADSVKIPAKKWHPVYRQLLHPQMDRPGAAL